MPLSSVCCSFWYSSCLSTVAYNVACAILPEKNSKVTCAVFHSHLGQNTITCWAMRYCRINLIRVDWHFRCLFLPGLARLDMGKTDYFLSGISEQVVSYWLCRAQQFKTKETLIKANEQVNFVCMRSNLSSQFPLWSAFGHSVLPVVQQQQHNWLFNPF